MSAMVTAALSAALLQIASAQVDPAALVPAARVQAVRLSSSLTLDGDLSDPAWAGATVIGGFHQREPEEGAPASLETQVRVIYDDASLFVAARLFDPAPDSIVGRLARRDNWVVSDRFVVFLDPYHDKRTGFFFGVNAAGTLYDGTLLNDEWDDDTWDGIWDAKVRRDSLGWTVEMRIPYSQLRFQQGAEYEWGINFRRDIARRNEASFLVYQPRKENGFVSRFPTMHGIQAVQPPRRLEFVPYVTSKAEFLDHPKGDPFNDGSRFRASAGADMKLGIGSNLTLDATVNPDFGQVEVDPAVVNLTDVETFYPEKRPFFVEGQSIFDFGFGGANNFWGFGFGGPDFFYSRRIGRAPSGSVPGADYADVPQGTTILGAAKLSGKLGRNLSLGALSALTNRERARLAGPGGRFEAVVEPRTSYNLLRVRQEIAGGRQSIGLLATGTFRDLEPRLRPEMNSDAETVGLDGWSFLDQGKMWVLTGWTGASRVSGSQERITALQQNPVHYFQRPDADHVSVDRGGTSLQGWAGRMWLNKQRGEWLLNAAFGAISPGFESNDIGFLSRADVLNGHVVGSRRWTTPGKLFRFARINAASFRTYDFGGVRTGEGYVLSGGADLLNYHGFEAFMAVNPERWNTRRARGGPVMLAPAGFEAEVGYNTDDRKSIIGNLNLSRSSYGRGDTDLWGANLEVEFKPAAAVSFRVGPALEWARFGAQYVGAYGDSLASRTFGSRYVFANLRQTTLSANVRLNWTFSPTMSLEVFAQPLVSSGDYRGYKELSRPRSYDFLTYGAGGSTLTPNTDVDGHVVSYDADPDGAGPSAAFEVPNLDFSFASLRGNAVLRWEYLPGSTLYLVWTQDRSDFQPNGEFDLDRSLRRLGGARGNHVFAVKVSYWWHP